MADPTTTNLQFAQPTRGSDVGTWDTPVNNNMGILDTILGQTTTITLNNANVVLSAAQFQSRMLIFSSTLTGSVTITFPTSFVKSYEILNACTGSSAFTITLATTVAAANVVGCPPREVFEVASDGSNIRYKNFGRIGSYWDYAGSSVPNWVSACNVPPYLNCDGTAFSSVSYPALATILGGTTLPDARGRTRAVLNQGTARMTLAGSSVDGNTLLAAGGNELMQQHTHVSSFTGQQSNYTVFATGGNSAIVTDGTIGTGLISGAGGQVGKGAFAQGTPVGTVSVSNAGSGGSQNMQPTYIGGLTLIRAG